MPPKSTTNKNVCTQERIDSLQGFGSLLSHGTLCNGILGNTSAASATSGNTVGNAGSGGKGGTTARSLMIERQKKKSNTLAAHSNGGPRGGPSSASTSLVQHMYRDDLTPLGGSFCSIPSMDFLAPEDIANGDDQGGTHRAAQSGISNMEESSLKSSVFPGLGSSHHSSVPEMTATVLEPCSPTASSASTNSTSNCTQNSSIGTEQQNPEQLAAQNMARPITWTRSSVSQAPSVLSQSLVKSFSSLVNSRVRAWTLFLLRHSLSSGDKGSRDCLLNFLGTRSSFEFTAIVTTFEALELPEEARVALEEEAEMRRNSTTNKKKEFTTDECDLVLPLSFECVIDLLFQGAQLSIKLNAPGTIAAMYHEDSNLMTFVECKLDSKELIESMLQQARLVVFQAVAKATSFKTPSTVPESVTSSSQQQQQQQQQQQGIPRTIPTTIPRLGSAMSMGSMMTGNGRTKSNLKVAASALRFSSVLSSNASTRAAAGPKVGGNNNNSNNTNPLLRKVMGDSTAEFPRKRSVTWGRPVEDSKSHSSYANHSSGKKQKLGQMNSLQRSIKSFGKPDANDFECVRNSTFAEFGVLDKRPVSMTHRTGVHGAGAGADERASSVHRSTTMGGMKSYNNINESFQLKKNFSSKWNSASSTSNHNTLDARSFFNQFSVKPGTSTGVSSSTSPTPSRNASMKHTPTQLELMLAQRLDDSQKRKF